MQHLDTEYPEFKNICTDLCRLYEQAESLRDRIARADDEDEFQQLCNKFAVIKECIEEGTEFLQNHIFALDKLGEYKVSQIAAKEVENTTVAQAMEDENLRFASGSVGGYVFFRDEYEDD